MIEMRSLKNSIDRYLTGQWDHEKLERSVIEQLQTILDSGDKQAIKLANQIDAALIDLSEGLLTEDAFRKHLAGLLEYLNG